MGYKRIQFHSGLQPEHSPTQYLYNKHNYIKKAIAKLLFRVYFIPAKRRDTDTPKIKTIPERNSTITVSIITYPSVLLATADISYMQLLPLNMHLLIRVLSYLFWW